MWSRVQKRLKARSSIGTHEYLGKVSTFTSLITCAVCGSPVFTKSCARKEGSHRYLACGRRLMHGRLICQNSTYYREARLLARIQETFRVMFSNIEDLIEPIMAETRKLVETNQSALKAAKAEAAKLEGEIHRFSALLLDPDMDDLAKRALGREMSNREALLEQMREQIAEIADSSTTNAADLERAVRQAFEEAKADLTKANTIPQLREFIAKHVGPMLLTGDRTIIQAPREDQAASLLTVHHAPPEMTVSPARPASPPNRSACSRP